MMPLDILGLFVENWSFIVAMLASVVVVLMTLYLARLSSRTAERRSEMLASRERMLGDGMERYRSEYFKARKLVDEKNDELRSLKSALAQRDATIRDLQARLRYMERLAVRDIESVRDEMAAVRTLSVAARRSIRKRAIPRYRPKRREMKRK